ncbi:DNA-formamidopyrimidine glycosylase [Rubinisphaera margarita]|uniref:DNA-formamidopyrimidine glycosylase n=1 Tax=Rubinisphaera margarita TaxID=2909586 RepID=UPI001EE91A26|nr:DNA-formamidopyrimidine glycosylase [Rubinisphaera margarita]MCG6157741.1 DNA-formamidopyrimidine glycosylase [Rubinisphaera margarita]
MPELPEVETMVRGIRDAVEGATLTRVELPVCACRPISIKPDFPLLQERVAGRKIVEATRRAKRVVLRLDNDDRFVVEPRMTGLVLLEDAPDETHFRFEWHLLLKRRRSILRFWDRRGLGTVRLFSAEEYEQELGPPKLGPDALEMTPKLWATQLSRTARPLKVALLDQKLVAGIGNLYASEILHLAKLSPHRPANSLERAEWNRLNKATLKVLELAIRYEGSTLGDGTYRNALNKDGSYQNQHRVYMKHDQKCPTCRKGTIERIVQAQRSTFFCAKCQPE